MKASPADELERSKRVLELQAKVAERTGACQTLWHASPAHCDGFEPASPMNGFAMCACGHTQWSHAS